MAQSRPPNGSTGTPRQFAMHRVGWLQFGSTLRFDSYPVRETL